MEFLEALLNVLAIIGIIVAAAFIIFFLGDLLLSVLEPKNKEKTVEEPKQLTNQTNEPQAVNYTTYEDYVKTKDNENEMGTITEFVPEEPVKPEEEVQDINYEEALKEKSMLGLEEKEEDAIDFSKPAEDENFDDLDNLFNDDDFNFSDDFDFNFGDEETKEEVAVMNEKVEEVERLAEPEIIQEEIIEEKTEVAKQTTETENPYNVVEISRENEAVNVINVSDEENARMQEEIALLRAELENQKTEYEKLRQESEFKEEKLKIEKIQLEELYSQAEIAIQREKEEEKSPLLSIEEYEARLETLRARLKVNEKELKETKKEFLPLRKVRKTLDSDKKKLRRREALVAKQKVVLYGVNNIMEIDEEKAKKLAEDLDLLDGLKVSVQHCEEVMEANKERYPILETTYRILTTVNQDLKDDIAECEANIAKLKANADSNSDDSAVKEAKIIVNEVKEEQPVEVLVIKEEKSNKTEKAEKIEVNKEENTEKVKDEKVKEEKTKKEKPAKAEKVKKEKEEKTEKAKADKSKNKEEIVAETTANEQPEKDVAVIVVEDVKPAEIVSENQKETNINLDAFSFETETTETKDSNKDFDLAFLDEPFVDEVKPEQKQNVSISDDLEFNEPEVKDDFDFETSYETFADFQKSLMNSGFLKEEPKEVEVVEEPKEEAKKVKTTKVKVEKVTVEASSTESADRKGGRPKKSASVNDIEDLF